MNTQEISLLAIQRYRAVLSLIEAKQQFIDDITEDNFKSMQLKQRYYQSFQSKIYSYSNIIEMLELLKESADKKIILDELDGYVVSLSMSKNSLPMVIVKVIDNEAQRP